MGEPFSHNEIKIAVIGGGTGSFTLLSEFKRHTSQIAAIVNMADDGGSTGVLRDEYGALPPGDVRQCLVALSDSDNMRDLFNYRYGDGTFAGHSFGNLFLAALEKTAGGFANAVDVASDILRINGVVIPGTYDDVRLKMEWPERSVMLHGERVIDADHFRYDPRKAMLSLVPNPTVNPMAIRAIESADVVVIAPGDLYTSLGPLLVIDGIGKALVNTDATVIYVCNLVTKEGQTSEFSVADHAAEIQRFAGFDFLDVVLYNSYIPSDDVLARYKAENAYLVEAKPEEFKNVGYDCVGGNFIGELAERDEKSEKIPVTRSLIRHDAEAVAKEIIRIHEESKPSYLDTKE